MIVTAGHLVGGRYRLIQPIGQGGMAMVWHGHDEMLGREVAVKQILMSPETPDSERRTLIDRVLREARNAARLSDHPNIVAVHDVVLEDGVPWTIMQLVAGHSLQQYLDAWGPLPADRVADVAAALLKALGAAHAAGIVHRDVKPGNVMLADNGEILLTDFGIAIHQADIGLTMTGMFVGSPGYAAPERLRGGDADGSTDLFSLGVTLYRAVEGTAPFPDGNPLAVLDDPIPPPQRAGALAPLIMRLLEKEPSRRPSVPEALAMIGAPMAPMQEMPTVLAAPLMPAPGAETMNAAPANTWPNDSAPVGATAVMPTAMGQQNPAMLWQSPADPGAPTGTAVPGGPGFPPGPPNRAKKSLSDLPVAVPIVGIVVLIVIAVVALVIYNGNQKSDANAAAPTTPSATAGSSAPSQVTLSGSPSPSQSPSAQATTGTITGYQGLCLDDSHGSTSNGNPVMVYTCNGGTNQTWTVGTDGTIRTLGMCLDVGGGSTNNGATVDLYSCNGTGAQVWQAQSNGELVNPQSGKCLDDTNFGGAGTQVQIWGCSGGANQTWNLPTAAAQTGTGTITGYQGLCLDDSGGSTANSNPVIVYSCNGGTNQSWTVGTDGTLRTLGMCLDVGGGSTNNGATVDLYGCNGTGAQVWQAQSNGELVNPQSGRCLDDTNFGGAGTQVQIWDCGDGPNQQWKLP